MNKQQICPRCDGETEILVALPWGHVDGDAQRSELAPYICSLCGSLLLIDTETKKLFVIPEEGIEMMKRNKPLWDAISQSQELIRNLPNRRPVLR